MLEKCASIIVIIVFLANTLTGHISLHRGVLKKLWITLECVKPCSGLHVLSYYGGEFAM